VVVIYDFATAPFWIFLKYMRNIWFSFISVREVGPRVALASFLSASLVGSRGCGGAAAGWTAG
jgi:hypothetical protein